MINFDALPEPIAQSSEDQFNPKPWNIPPIKFEKQCIKIIKIQNQLRLTLPRLLCQAYKLDENYKAYKAYFIYYEAMNKLSLILSQNTIEGADYTRNIHPVASGLCFTVIPYAIVKRIGRYDFPECIWLVNTPKSTEEDIMLEVWPA